MIGKWLRQDPATRAVTNWLLIGPLSMSAVLALIAWNAADGARRAQEVGSWSLSGFSTWIGLLWLAVGPFLLTPGCRERCSRLSLTLPQSPRKLWLVHLVAIFLAKAAIGFVAAALVLLKAGILIYVLDGRNIFQPDVVRLVLFASSGFVLATVLVQSLQPELRRIPMTKRNAALTAVIHVGVWGTILLLGSQSVWFALVPLGAALLVGSRTYKGMPTTFSVVSLELERPFRVNEDRARPVRGTLYHGFTSCTVWRCLGGGKLQWLWFAAPFIIPLGILLAGVSWAESADLYYARFTVVPITVYLVLAFVSLPMRNLYRLDPLPLSRRRLLAHIFLPSLVLLSMGYGAGKLWERSVEPRELIVYRMDRDSHFYVYVPAWALEIAWSGDVSDNSSPWGETHEAWISPVLRGARPLLYSPYHTPVGSSIDFVALQISRTAEKIYGEQLPTEEIKRRYLEVDSEGKVILKGETLTLQKDYPHLAAVGRGPHFPVILMLVGLPWMLLVAVYMRSFRATISDGKRKVLLFALMGILLVVYLTPYGLFIAGVTKDWLLTGLVEILIWNASESFSGAGVAIWMVCLALLYAGFRIAESHFRRVEIPPMPDRLPVIEAWASN